jgi:hypothetical protein
MRKDRAMREAEEQNRNEHTTAYFAFHAGHNRWQVRRREPTKSDDVVVSE